MEELQQTIQFIEDNNASVDFLLLTLETKVDNAIYKECVDKIKNIDCFKDLFPTPRAIEFSEHIRFLKLFNTDRKNTFSLILFNPMLYQSENPDMPEVVDNMIKVSDNLTFKLLSANENTGKLIEYIKTKPNFLTAFIDRQNRKKRHSTKLWKTTILENKELNIERMDKKSSYTEKRFVVVKNKLKKNVKITQDIQNERICGSIRIGLPNTITLWLEDNSYLSMNKIFITKNPFLGMSLQEKILYIFEIYETIFGIAIPLEGINFYLNFSLYHQIDAKLLYFENNKAKQNSFGQERFIFKTTNLAETKQFLQTCFTYKEKNDSLVDTIKNLNLNDLFKRNDSAEIDDLIKKFEYPIFPKTD
ncbi:putative viral intermediate transcription factor 3 large subunit [Diachasmimorpha longicaudata entomopoxvirus]|uniref:Putative viral intermediate transcription factor 3 large subunit n=1 Tax=Diachasmimorpha longicaudata entomopoxvirus TaxID=109981 RepID=A0A7R5WG04_9POXV|nr:putative viral intermediate transcription factor 3 large subunit [Diachasmimorpha longicaudata entomopoxvirus]AKS26350.1 putative viral intermediate transcription factor 3 large subunit [Diachasmimorpha longicaudata entomopoxvirus]